MHALSGLIVILTATSLRGWKRAERAMYVNLSIAKALDQSVPTEMVAFVRLQRFGTEIFSFDTTAEQKSHLEGAAVYDHSWPVRNTCMHIGHYCCQYDVTIKEILGTGLGKYY